MNFTNSIFFLNQRKKMHGDMNLEMNKELKDIPFECSVKYMYLPTVQKIWNFLMNKIFDNSFDENENPNYEMRVEVDLVTKDKKPTHPIVKQILYAKAKEQYLAGHGFQFGFYNKPNTDFETMICFYNDYYKGLPSNLSFVH